MLLKHGEVNRPVKAGKNLAELKQTGTQIEELSNGQKRAKPVWGSVYMVGLPFGDNAPDIKAPIDLEAGDIVYVAADGNVPYSVSREGKEVWANPDLHRAEAEKAAETLERVRIRKENRR